MMMQEFIDRTGFEPTAEEYAEIEQQYYSFDGNKDAFCKHWKDTVGVEGICKARAEKITQLRSTMVETEKELMRAIAEKDGLIARLKADLEREQEWKPWTPERVVSQKEYDHLRSSGHEMTDDEAKEWIFREFGFAQQAIRIHRLMNVQEINRHHMLRKVGEIDRTPYYDATDWYYIFFSVRGIEYEAYNGSLNQL